MVPTWQCQSQNRFTNLCYPIIQHLVREDRGENTNRREERNDKREDQIY